MIPGDIIGSDCETTGLFWRFGDRPYCFAFCNLSGDTDVVSFSVDPFTRKVAYTEAGLKKLRAYYEDPTKTFIFHNAAFDVGMLQSLGIKIAGKVVCSLIMVRLIDSGEKAALKDYCARKLGIPTDDESALIEATRKARALGKKKGWKIYEKKSKSEKEILAPDYWMAGPKMYEPYCVRDAARCLAVFDILFPEIEKRGLTDVYRTELKTWKVMREVENRGIRIDKVKVINSKIALKKKFQMYCNQARLIAKVPNLNLQSPLQLSKILYGRLNQPVTYYTAGGQPSTKNAALKAIRHPFARMVLNARACVKTVEFMDQYLRFMVRGQDGLYYIHAEFHESYALTGRESCSHPNLQQVAKGKNEDLEVRVEARSVFMPRPNYTMFSYDYKNIEVYIPAFKSQDPQLCKMLLAGEDVHEYTTKNLTKIIGEKITRDVAKRTYFALQYGARPPRIAETLGISLPLAEKISIGIEQTYPVLWEWMHQLISRIRSTHQIVTPYGRIMRVPEREEYAGVNYFIQGTASSILKKGKIRVVKAFKENGWDAHIVLPIHDENLNEYHNSMPMEDIHRTVVKAMQYTPELNMPVRIPVSISRIGKNWADKTKISA